MLLANRSVAPTDSPTHARSFILPATPPSSVTDDDKNVGLLLVVVSQLVLSPLQYRTEIMHNHIPCGVGWLNDRASLRLA